MLTTPIIISVSALESFDKDDPLATRPTLVRSGTHRLSVDRQTTAEVTPHRTPMNLSMAEPEIGPAERERVLSVLESGHLAAGSQVEKFESEFADYCGTDHAVATMNGTGALHAALEALELRPDAGVITSPFSFVATANAIRLAGCHPRFGDIHPETLNLDPDAVEAELECDDGTIDAILVVHLFGLPADMVRFRELAEEYDVALIEDAAQAHGATVEGSPVGSIGDVGCFSFYPTKNMTTGEGGMVTTNREDIANAVRQFIDHGRGSNQYAHTAIGHNFRMTDIAAGIGRAQLEKLPRLTESRRKNARYLTSQLSDLPVITPPDLPGRRHVFHQYTIRSSQRDAYQSTLDQLGVESTIYYPTPIPDLEAYRNYSAGVPNAREAASTVLSVPIHPNVTTEGLDLIATGFGEAPELEVPG